MKKILVLFLLFFAVGNASALEYSDYTDFSEYTENYIQSNDLTDVKVERRYKYYKLEKELGGYGENDSVEYPLIDKDDYIYTDYSNVSIEKPLEKEGRIIETLNGYHYKKIKDINYIIISASMADIGLENIKLIYDGQELEYEMETNKTIGNLIKQSGYIKLKLNKLIDVSKLKINYDCIEKSNNSALIFIRIGRDDTEYAYTQVTAAVSKNVSWNGLSMPAYQSSYEDYYSEDSLKEGESIYMVDNTTLYRYKDILYRNYKLNKIYYVEYTTMPFEDFIYKDETLYKDYYSKRTRTILPEIVNNINEEHYDKSDVSDNPQKMNIVSDKTDNIYKIPSKAISYPLNIQKIDDLKEVKTLGLLYTFLPMILLLVILILVLSKLYKKKKECATV